MTKETTQPEQEPVDDYIASLIACRDMIDAQPVPELSPESLYNIMEAMGFAQRPWVDLTPQDLNEIFAVARTGEHAVHLASDRLKEKNNG